MMDDTRSDTFNSEERVNRARLQVDLAVAGIGVLALLALLVIVLLLLPYSPMTIYSYEATVDEACPSELVPVYVEYRLERGVDFVEVAPDWIADDVEKVPRGYLIEGAEGRIPGEALMVGERAKVRSSVVRVAPTVPGMWRVGGSIAVHGEVYRIPRIQQLNPRADEPIAILPPDAPECENAYDTTKGD